MFQRLKHHVNGNPRFATSWCGFGFKSYAQAIRAANSLGGRKYDTQSFGGGLVFQAYECELPDIAAKLTQLAKGE